MSVHQRPQQPRQQAQGLQQEDRHPALPQRACLRFYGELNDFLRLAQRGREVAHAFLLPPAVKDAIEACGIPHTEVGLILINGRAAGFRDRLQDGDRVSVYPVFQTLDIAALQKVRPAPLRRVRFAVDANLGRLAVLLRLLGFDAVYRNDFEDAVLARLAVAEQRILLTRDRGLLKRSLLAHASYVRATRPEQQLLEVLRRFDLERQLQPFTRCLRCNGELRPVEKQAVENRLPPRVQALGEVFSCCRGCGRVYWPGSHFRRMQEVVRSVQAALAEGGRNDEAGGAGA